MSRDPIVPLLDPGAVAEAAAEIFAACADAALATSGRFTVALAGGATPRAMYRLLASEPYSARIPWEHVHVLFGDERCVPSDHPESNYRMARQTLLDHVPVPRDQVHPISGHLANPSRAAHFYEAELRGLFPSQDWPAIDLVLLGAGEDGHTASLFPGHDALGEGERWALAAWIPKFESWRITLTLPVLCRARMILFLITGERKAQVVHEAFGGAPHDGPHPCELVIPVDGKREVLVDRDAARLL